MTVPFVAHDQLFREGGWSWEVADGLRRMLAGPPSVAAFDFDQTVLRGDVSERLLHRRQERTQEPLVARYEAGCARDLRTAYAELVHTLVAGLTELEARREVQDLWREGSADGTLHLRSSMRELIWALQRSGWQVWVVTASPEVLVQALAEQVGIPPERVLGMRPEVGEHGRYLPRLLEPITCFEGKLEALTRHLDRPLGFAAGDSVSDEVLLGAAAHALLIDRGAAELRSRAVRRGWWVQPADDLS